MKKRVFLLLAGVVLVFIGVVIGKASNKEDIIMDDKEVSVIKHENSISMMLETEAGSGNYEMTTASSWPTDGYVFNSELSKCENGGELSWDDVNKSVLMSGNVSDKCYVYFDLYKPTLAEYVISQYNGVQGNNNIYYHDSNLTNGAGDNSYRYAGSNDTTNNYVCFNTNENPCPTDNLYRIIGVFGENIKLIKYDYATSLELGTDGLYAKDILASSYTSYYRGKLNNLSLYYAGNSNKLAYVSKTLNEVQMLANRNEIAAGDPCTSDVLIKINESELGLINLNRNFYNYFSDSYKVKIVSYDWTINSVSVPNLTTPLNVYKTEMTNDTSTIVYSANIGLIYLSDYGYAASPSAWTTSLGGYNDSSITTENWMYMGATENVISYYSACNPYTIVDTGAVTSTTFYVNLVIRPSFYLGANTYYKSGIGSISDPIIIGD